MLPKIFNRFSTTSPAIRDGRYVIIDWNDSAVGIHEMTLLRGEIAISRSSFEQWPTDSAVPESALQIGEWLQRQLQHHQITATAVVVSVPRRHVTLRLLEFPLVEDDELASLIEMQVEGQLDHGAPEQPFDFIPQPAGGDTENRHALVATVPAATLQQITEVIDVAGLKLKATCVGELALDALENPKDNGGITLNLLANHSKAEFILSHARMPIASHSVRMPTDSPATLGQTIPTIVARMVAALPDRFRSMSVSRINLLGPFAQQLQPTVANINTCDVQVISLGNDDAVRPLAVLKSLAHRQGTVNFLARKRPIDLKQLQRRQWIRYGIGATVLVSLLALWQHSEKRGLENRLAELKVAGAGLMELNERGAATLEEWKFVNDWQAFAVNWSHEIKNFAEHLPEPGQAYLTRLQVEQPAGSQSPIIRVDGIAKNADIAMGLNRSLMATGNKYDLHPHGIGPATRDADFKSSFQIEASINSADHRSSR